MPIATLHIDIEGGHGGSSISLFQLLSRIDRSRLVPVVVHGKEGPVSDWYEGLGIPAYHIPEICSFVPRSTKALKNFLATLPRMRHLDRAAKNIANIARRHDAKLIHLNYEGLFLLAEKLQARTGLPMIAHSRAHLPVSPWGRWLARRLSRNVQYVFFISPQEESRWQQIAGGSQVPGEVMWNIARAPLPRQPFAAPPEVIYLGNIAWSKGTDRIVDIAAAYQKKGGDPLVFAIYGESRLGDRYDAEVQRRIDASRLAGVVQLRGRIADPSPVLARAFALVRPSRENDPWGRDVIEATTAGVPILATGRFDGVVRDADNGYLVDPFDADQFADRLSALRGDTALWRRMSEAGERYGQQRFAGATQAERFTKVVERLVTPSASVAAA